jgi:hypothetical protein
MHEKYLIPAATWGGEAYIEDSGGCEARYAGGLLCSVRRCAASVLCAHIQAGVLSVSLFVPVLSGLQRLVRCWRRRRRCRPGCGGSCGVVGCCVVAGAFAGGGEGQLLVLLWRGRLLGYVGLAPVVVVRLVVLLVLVSAGRWGWGRGVGRGVGRRRGAAFGRLLGGLLVPPGMKV